MKQMNHIHKRELHLLLLYQQKERMAMGSSLSLAVSNIFTALSVDHKPDTQLRQVNNTLWFGHMGQ
jgi:hypothetical protein